MKSKITIGISLFMMTFGLVKTGSSTTAPSWKRWASNTFDSEAVVVQISPQGDQLIAGTRNSVYKYDLSSQSFKLAFIPQGHFKSVNAVHFFEDSPGEILLATDAGLYQSLNNGHSWERIYYSSDPQSRRSLSVVQYNQDIYLGTAGGLITLSRNQSRWRKTRSDFNNKPVSHLLVADNHIFAAVEHEIIRINPADFSRRVIFSSFDAPAGNVSEFNNEQKDAEIRPTIKDFLYIREAGGLLAATAKGIFLKYLNDTQWARLPAPYSILEDLTSLLVVLDQKTSRVHPPLSRKADEPVIVPTQEYRNEDGALQCKQWLDCFTLLAGTDHGAFSLENGQWMPVYKGMETTKVNDLATDGYGNVYAATDKGIFMSKLGETLLEHLNPAGAINYAEARHFFESEPGILDVHRWAIRYAEVQPEKIAQWRTLARKRAWLPSMSIGLDGNRDMSLSDSVYGSSSNGGAHYVGPDDKSFGRDFGWDVSLSWDFGDLVWSTDQTTIDSRSKLMVELREDILDQATRIYFERRREQMELTVNAQLAPGAKFEKEMRIEELTALLDALTGGKFSLHLQDNFGSPGYQVTRSPGYREMKNE